MTITCYLKYNEKLEEINLDIIQVLFLLDTEWITQLYIPVSRWTPARDPAPSAWVLSWFQLG